MDFKQFEYVIAVNNEKSISKAAKKLFISQPSLSQYIGRIEDELNVAIFDRTTSPISLTHEGEIYLETAHKILDLTDEMKKCFSDVDNLKTGRINIGLTPSKATDPLPLILPVFKQKYPGIELHLTEASSEQLELLLSKNLIDICIMNLPIVSQSISYNIICDEEIFLAAPPDFPLQHITLNEGKKTHTDYSQLSGKEFILLHNDQRLRQIAEKFFSDNKISPNILLETRGIETALRLSGEGMGFTFVPKSYTGYSTGYTMPTYYRIGFNGLLWTLVFAYSKGAYISHATKAFAETAQEIILSRCKA